MRRRERAGHVLVAGELPAYAVLLPEGSLAELLARNAARPQDEQVAGGVLAAFAHRRSLLTRELLLLEGFRDVMMQP